MKKLLIVTGLGLLLCTIPNRHVQAQVPIYDIIKAAVKKVIMAVDLKIQRLQNKTIWLQNAQKRLENAKGIIR
jgi:hypothetical protein